MYTIQSIDVHNIYWYWFYFKNAFCAAVIKSDDVLGGLSIIYQKRARSMQKTKYI